ncbi:phosphatidylglycerol lysyltransferase domain-containing protein [Paracoccus amoyensis]|uniref:phosphatidylglycerol lysyltransferase domain-containing protein n=1 Tax=Paracoccus amoyensis TaxID=2760093 RepID=UPI0016590402|nr:phosphatidylglycerol lysyltransferase domain-containing protein [Paracoccus amoyensis]
MTELRPDVDIIQEDHAGSVILYRQRNGAEAELYTAPMPCTAETLKHAMQRVQDMNGRSRVNIRYVEASQMPEVARAGFTLHAREEESIMDADKVRALDGSEFKRVRREISKVSSQPGTLCRDYQPEDEAACLDVLARWRERLKQAGLPIEGNRLTKDCLRHAPDWPREVIRGRVCEVDGEIRGFTFAGPISPDCGNLFVGISDTDIRGLAYLIRHDQVMEWPGLRFFNHGGDAGRSGLNALKDAFRPIDKAPVYRAVFS